jgi:hypothetical protein
MSVSVINKTIYSNFTTEQEASTESTNAINEVIKKTNTNDEIRKLNQDIPRNLQVVVKDGKKRTIINSGKELNDILSKSKKFNNSQIRKVIFLSYQTMGNLYFTNAIAYLNNSNFIPIAAKSGSKYKVTIDIEEKNIKIKFSNIVCKIFALNTEGEPETTFSNVFKGSVFYDLNTDKFKIISKSIRISYKINQIIEKIVNAFSRVLRLFSARQDYERLS